MPTSPRHIAVITNGDGHRAERRGSEHINDPLGGIMASLRAAVVKGEPWLSWAAFSHREPATPHSARPIAS